MTHKAVLTALALLALLIAGPTLAQDVTRPEAVSGLLGDRSGDDVVFSWDPVTLDAAGQSETIDHYNVYRGTTSQFIPDKTGGSNLIGTSVTETFSDVAAATDGFDYFYRVSAVDTAGNESDTMPTLIGPPVLSGFWTNTTIEIDWTSSEPSADVVSYRVYYGQAERQYDTVIDVGPALAHSLVGLSSNTLYYISVTGVDVNGNESPFSNEHVDVRAGIYRFAVLDEDELCWGGSQCPPVGDRVQRNGGFQILAPVVFPPGDWNNISVTFTMESRLCRPPFEGTVSRCGPGNPCPEPPCNGGYNPCGDPWDRLAKVFLVLDDCIEQGGSCVTNENLELIRAITPFGTDAEQPEGTGFVPPRVLTMDITPYAPLLTGTKYVGAEIVHFVQSGWWVSVDFSFSKRPGTASPKPPADGIQIVGYANAPLTTRQVTIPPGATEVKARIFTTGHGGSLFCDGGTNNAQSCTNSGDCPGGVCNPCDEFCHRSNQLLVDGEIGWQFVPYRTDCSPAANQCYNWNACGIQSCTFPRAGWCPGYIACHHNAPCDNDIDMTFELAPGGTYDVDYIVTPRNGSWPVSVVVFWYE